MENKLIIRGARENNLKNVDLTIPRDKLISIFLKINLLL